MGKNKLIKDQIEFDIENLELLNETHISNGIMEHYARDFEIDYL